MALTTILIGNPTVFGDKRVAFARVQFDTAYAVGGESLSPRDLGFAAALFDLVVPSPNSGLIFEFDHVNNKLKAMYPTGGSTTPGSLTDPSASVPAGATAVTSSGATPPVTMVAGRGREVANNTNLSSVAVRLLCICNA